MNSRKTRIDKEISTMQLRVKVLSMIPKPYINNCIKRASSVIDNVMRGIDGRTSSNRIAEIITDITGMEVDAKESKKFVGYNDL